MAKITEDDMFEGSYSSRGDDSDVMEGPTIEELQANMKAARAQSVAHIPVEPMSFPPNKAVINTLNSREEEDLDDVLEEMDREDAEANQLSEVEVKLEKANCYKVLLQDSMFEDYTSATAEVEAEIRSFIHKRLRILMGIEQEGPVASGTFSKEEVNALKHLASRVISKNPQAAATVAPPPKREEKVLPKLRVRQVEQVDNGGAIRARPVSQAPRRPVANLNAVPEKVKPVRKKKEMVEIALPNGFVVQTENTPPPKRTLQDLQDIADQARIAAERDIHSANSNKAIEKMLKG